MKDLLTLAEGKVEPSPYALTIPEFKNLSVNEKYNKSIASGLFRNNYLKNEQNQDISKTQHKSSTNQISTTEIISENYKRKMKNNK
jgi:hypothetical protein